MFKLYFDLGVEHITDLAGFDHILFLASYFLSGIISENIKEC